jgi:hypothetical protein
MPSLNAAGDAVSARLPGLPCAGTNRATAGSQSSRATTRSKGVAGDELVGRELAVVVVGLDDVPQAHPRQRAPEARLDLQGERLADDRVPGHRPERRLTIGALAGAAGAEIAVQVDDLERIDRGEQGREREREIHVGAVRADHRTLERDAVGQAIGAPHQALVGQRQCDRGQPGADCREEPGLVVGEVHRGALGSRVGGGRCRRGLRGLGRSQGHGLADRDRWRPACRRAALAKLHGERVGLDLRGLGRVAIALGRDLRRPAVHVGLDRVRDLVGQQLPALGALGGELPGGHVDAAADRDRARAVGLGDRIPLRACMKLDVAERAAGGRLQLAPDRRGQLLRFSIGPVRGSVAGSPEQRSEGELPCRSRCLIATALGASGRCWGRWTAPWWLRCYAVDQRPLAEIDLDAVRAASSGAGTMSAPTSVRVRAAITHVGASRAHRVLPPPSPIPFRWSLPGLPAPLVSAPRAYLNRTADRPHRRSKPCSGRMCASRYAAGSPSTGRSGALAVRPHPSSCMQPTGAFAQLARLLVELTGLLKVPQEPSANRPALRTALDGRCDHHHRGVHRTQDGDEHAPAPRLRCGSRWPGLNGRPTVYEIE